MQGAHVALVSMMFHKVAAISSLCTWLLACLGTCEHCSSLWGVEPRGGVEAEPIQCREGGFP